ncbi:Catabolite control protein A [Lentilactobacillus parabuchneri]|jgi:LacI family sucrose operon transcriptional repressor|uniref:Catabolite control protein A n=2 Tax=Lentilactobacillus parabuchneri TaxID=152331 RepID=A0A1X1FE29_9LACO|nr:LacI family DNA-binding transcriptional regulator [Lentilactobacillus parabuchneri]APR07747.1 Catabolite control protein A [Lentilactobacillus parabuchneri]KRM46992.1 lacI family transcriptional regulator [Lentilactobacillus parabuchneri DSM 5707 = NBRC 107865]KRN70753.1 lacI family transcriptional regulator [Lentilactobacillus parabuchneri]MBW0222278.1 LacI family DNA-binding transcriptional regulator [Lentilactobacillus parabuchneri]MBW0245485.1 LacI family DNA-binding transcriptional reg
MQPKLADVAKLAGVSVTTVSRVINDRGYLSANTKEKVFAAMQQLNYQPSLAARVLQGKQFKLVGLIFASLENPFIAQLVVEIENRLFTHGYKAIICNSMDNPEKEQQYLKMLLANQVDGIITGSHNEGIEEYKMSGLPIVSSDRYFQNKIPTVSSDNQAGGELAARTMIEKGSKKFMLVSGSLEKKAPNNARITGFEKIAADRKFPVEVVEFPFNSTPTIRRATLREKLLSYHPDGIFCTDDQTALLCMQEARKLGMQIPKDVQVIGYDGSDYVQEYHPELSTIVQPVSDIAELLVRLLFNRLQQNDDQLLDKYVLPIKLLQRESLRK